MNSIKTISLAAISLAFATSAQAAVISFDILGKGGTGLRSTNETGTVTGLPGSGGEVGAGIFFDDLSKILTINVGWGSGNGFTDLTGTATLGHLHGATTDGGVASFSETSGVLLDLASGTTWKNSATAGGVTNLTIGLNPAQEAALLAEKTYFNFHTATNGGGEIRGNLVIVPEPSHALLSILGLSLLVIRRKR